VEVGPVMDRLMGLQNAIPDTPLKDRRTVQLVKKIACWVPKGDAAGQIADGSELVRRWAVRRTS